MPAQLELFDLPVDPDRGGGMVVPPWRGLRGWLEEIDRQLNLMRPSTPHYRRFDATARLLTVQRLRVTRDAEALEETAARLSEARRPCGYDLRDLHGVWSRARDAAGGGGQSRATAGHGTRSCQAEGPALDPRRLPDDRLQVLIQTHRDMAVVEALRAERARRSVQGGGRGRARASARDRGMVHRRCAPGALPHDRQVIGPGRPSRVVQLACPPNAPGAVVDARGHPLWG